MQRYYQGRALPLPAARAAVDAASTGAPRELIFVKDATGPE